MKKKNNNKKIKLNKILLIISIIMLLTSILIKTSNAIRPILWILSIIVFAINIKKSTNYTKSKVIVISIILFAVSLVIDGVIVYTFNKIPVFTYSITKKDNIIVYNSLGMRVWQCNENDYNNIIADPFYKKGYMCDANDIETMDINTFLNLVVQNHSEYKNNYVKLKGKISKKSGINSIEMKPYTTTDVQVNGYVEFASNITLKVFFQEGINIDNYDIYDEITIVGIVKNMESNQGNHTIYLSDTKLVSTINLDEYTLTVTKEKKCSEEPIGLYNHDEYNLYKYCLQEVLVTFPDGQYELSSALSSNKLQLNSLYNDYLKIEENDDNSKIYRFEEYSILVCDPITSKDIFIGPSNMKTKNVTCNELVNK